jgi:hypothetical protein
MVGGTMPTTGGGREDTRTKERRMRTQTREVILHLIRGDKDSMRFVDLDRDPESKFFLITVSKQLFGLDFFIPHIGTDGPTFNNFFTFLLNISIFKNLKKIINHFCALMGNWIEIKMLIFAFRKNEKGVFVQL